MKLHLNEVDEMLEYDLEYDRMERFRPKERTKKPKVDTKCPHCGSRLNDNGICKRCD